MKFKVPLGRVKELITIEDGRLMIVRGLGIPGGGPPIPRPFIAVLQRPDGTKVEAQAELQINDEDKWPDFLACILSGLRESDVPAGTEIWVDVTLDQNWLDAHGFTS
jgi:hypothetical protein